MVQATLLVILSLSQDCHLFTEAETGLWKEGLCGQEPDAQGKGRGLTWVI